MGAAHKELMGECPLASDQTQLELGLPQKVTLTVAVCTAPPPPALLHYSREPMFPLAWFLGDPLLCRGLLRTSALVQLITSLLASQADTKARCVLNCVPCGFGD